MKTPSFLELKSLVEYLAEELAGAQLQDVTSTADGVVLTFYRFERTPRTAYLVADLDRPFPFLGFFSSHPWPSLKKAKPVALFLKAHAKNRHFQEIMISADLGRVVRLTLEGECVLEFRLIPRQANLIVSCGGKSISWYPVQELGQNDPAYAAHEDEEVRSIAFMMDQWRARRGAMGQSHSERGFSPFEKWQKNKARDLEKKKKALVAVQEQIRQFQTEEWARVGEHLKQHGLKALPPEWSVFVDFEKSVSANMQKCFEKAKVAKNKVKGAEERILVLRQEIAALGDLGEEKFAAHLAQLSAQKNKPALRAVEGRLRKFQIEEAGLVAYIGKSAADNMALLRKAKPWDLWFHLKDYPSAHAILHKQKEQKISDHDLMKIAAWLVREGLPEKQTQMGGKFAVVIAECRHVKPLKGDKLGRVTYHHGRDVLIAI